MKGKYTVNEQIDILALPQINKKNIILDKAY